MQFDSARGFDRDLGAAGVSIQGLAHKYREMPCQDAFMIRHMAQIMTWRDGGNRDKLVSNRHYVIAAVADGLGSAAHSDIGAHAAVNTAVSTACEMVGTMAFGSDTCIRATIEEAMVRAYNATVKKAELLNVPPCDLDTTLVLAVYDGEKLYFGSAGDSGLIAKKQGGFELVSHPLRVGEAGVYPLYCRDHWEIAQVDGVESFLLATDGVLELLAPGLVGDDLNEQAISILLKSIPHDAQRANGAMERDLQRTVGALVEHGLTHDDASAVVVCDWDGAGLADAEAAVSAAPAASEGAEGAEEPKAATEDKAVGTGGPGSSVEDATEEVSEQETFAGDDVADADASEDAAMGEPEDAEALEAATEDASNEAGEPVCGSADELEDVAGEVDPDATIVLPSPRRRKPDGTSEFLIIFDAFRELYGLTDKQIVEACMCACRILEARGAVGPDAAASHSAASASSQSQKLS